MNTANVNVIRKASEKNGHTLVYAVTFESFYKEYASKDIAIERAKKIHNMYLASFAAKFDKNRGQEGQLNICSN
jgi:hypothetical protein